MDQPLPVPLTESQLEALQSWLEHGTAEKAAESSHKSTATIYSHLREVRIRLGVDNTAQAVVVAIEKGWIKRGKDGDISNA